MKTRYYVIFAAIGIVAIFPVMSIVFYGAVPIGINYQYFEKCEDCELYGCTGDEIYHRGICMTPEEKEKSESVGVIEEPLDGITVMRPNSMEFFYYPNPEDTENRDVFQKFVLIRLPEELGGDADDVSAFRAYSSVSISTDHCVTKYWPDKGRQRLEDPCWGTMYRAVDGLVMQNTDPVMITSPMALPYLDLSLDENGSLYIEPPVWTVEKNGVIGVGRSMSIQEIDQGSQMLVDSYRKSHPNHPSIPVSFAGYGLAEIDTHYNKIESRYYDYATMGYHSVFLEITNVSAQDQKYFLELAKVDSELWKIGETVIVIGGYGFDEKNTQQDISQRYVIQFLLDGFKYKVSGTNLELLKTSVVANFFPEYAYDDMLLVSSTVKNED